MRWRHGGRRGWESVHGSTLATLAEQNRCQVGPTILFDRPRQDPPPLASFVSQLGPPFCGCRVQSMRNGLGAKPFKFRPPRFRPPIKKMKIKVFEKRKEAGEPWRASRGGRAVAGNAAIP
jgi:hypothetical protein